MTRQQRRAQERAVKRVAADTIPGPNRLARRGGKITKSRNFSGQATVCIAGSIDDHAMRAPLGKDAIQAVE